MSTARRTCTALAVAALAFAGALAVVPPASAATSVSTWADLQTAVAAGGDVQLDADIDNTGDPGGYLTVPTGEPVTLDLNGHSLAISGVAVGDAAIEVPTGAALTIEDGVTDSVDNELTATGGPGAAGIGGAFFGGTGTIEITGGVVEATGGLDDLGLGGGAGIGAGILGTPGEIDITGGDVTATGGPEGAGIGGGSYADGGIITLDGTAKVTATGSSGAGIGGGLYGDGGTTTIGGTSQVNATGRYGGAGIGGGLEGAGGTVDITGGTVMTTSSNSGAAAIGGGVDGDGAAVTVASGASVTVSNGASFGPGSGSTSDWGSLSNAGTITLLGATDTASEATLTVPDGEEVINTGTITGAGSIDGTGTILNTGRIIDIGSIANQGQGDTGVTVTRNNYRLSFDGLGVTAGGNPDDLLALAASVTDADKSLPTPTLTNGGILAGWFTAASGGVRVTNSTQLSSLGDGPRQVTLYPRWAYPSTVTLSLSPATSVYGQAVTATATVSPSGSVRFYVDGTPAVAQVDAAYGVATSPALVDPTTGALLEPGTHTIRADLVPDAGGYLSSSGQATLTVTKAASTTALAVSADHLSAAVTPVAPGAGTVTGTVAFSVAGQSVGTATLEDGIATLPYTVSTDGTQEVAAVYDGDPHFTGSSDSTSRDNPAITAALSGKKGNHGWWRGPVTVTFTCTTAIAPLTGDCPTPVTLRGDGTGKTITRTIAATDGGAATVTITGIDIDHTNPVVKIRGAKMGHAHCVARDGVSGLTARGCRLTHKTTRKPRVTITRYTATATDRAGNTTTKHLTVRTRRG